MNKNILNKKVISWLYPKNKFEIKATNEEYRIASKLSKERGYEYLYARNCARKSLSQLFNLGEFEIPLISKFKSPPILEKGFGYISISHCNEFILIGWSDYPIGVDIENSKRNIPSVKLIKRYFKELKYLLSENLDSDKISEEILINWMVKEASFKCLGEKNFSDLISWKYNKKSNLAYKNENKTSLDIKIFKYKIWNYCIAINKNDRKDNNLIYEQVFFS